MLYALLTFPFVILLVVGGYWLFIVLPERREQPALRRRLKSEDPMRARARLKLVKDVDGRREIPTPNHLLHRIGALSGPLKEKIDQSGLKLNVGSFILLSVAGAFALPVVFSFLTPDYWRWLAVPAALVGAYVPYYVVNFMRDRQIR